MYNFLYWNGLTGPYRFRCVFRTSFCIQPYALIKANFSEVWGLFKVHEIHELLLNLGIFLSLMLCVVFLIRVKFISFSLILLWSFFILVILIINISLQRFLFLTRRRRFLVNMKFMRAKEGQLVRSRVNPYPSNFKTERQKESQFWLPLLLIQWEFLSCRWDQS